MRGPAGSSGCSSRPVFPPVPSRKKSHDAPRRSGFSAPAYGRPPAGRPFGAARPAAARTPPRRARSRPLPRPPSPRAPRARSVSPLSFPTLRFQKEPRLPPARPSQGPPRTAYPVRPAFRSLRPSRPTPDERMLRPAQARSYRSGEDAGYRSADSGGNRSHCPQAGTADGSAPFRRQPAHVLRPPAPRPPHRRRFRRPPALLSPRRR